MPQKMFRACFERSFWRLPQITSKIKITFVGQNLPRKILRALQLRNGHSTWCQKTVLKAQGRHVMSSFFFGVLGAHFGRKWSHHLMDARNNKRCFLNGVFQNVVFRGWSESARAECTKMLENTGVFRHSLSLCTSFFYCKPGWEIWKTPFGKHRLEPLGGCFLLQTSERRKRDNDNVSAFISGSSRCQIQNTFSTVSDSIGHF